MKKNVYLFGVMLWALSCFWGCSDNDDAVSPDRMIRLYGRSYNLQSGVVWQSNPNIVTSSVPYVYEDVYESGGEQVTDRVEGFWAGDGQTETGNFMLSLYEEGLYYNEKLEKASGRGACISFHLASAEIDRLVPGKYVFGTEKLPGTFIGYCSSDYNTSERENVVAGLAEGEVNVEQNGEEWHIKFQCKTTFGGEILGEYRGKLDKCKVSQVSSTEYKDISLAGLMDEVEVTYWYTKEFVEGIVAQLPGYSFEDVLDMFGLVMVGDKVVELESSGVDYDTEYGGNALFSLTSGICQIANDARRNREAIDLALVWDKTEETFIFESPIHIRSLLGHKTRYDFPCHTIYMKAPADFTDTDFENLSAEFFSFRIEDEKVEIPSQNFKPAYVFFQTGRGVLGVIKITDYIPMGIKTEYDMYGGGFLDYPRNPALRLEIKCPAVVANPQIR